jgi:hypothetical protein
MVSGPIRMGDDCEWRFGVQQRRRELEAAAKYTEQLKSAGLRRGRPDP